jgi:hypothetical protein
MIAVTVAERDLVNRRQVNLHALDVLHQRNTRDAGIPQDSEAGLFEINQRRKTVFSQQWLIVKVFHRIS